MVAGRVVLPSSVAVVGDEVAAGLGINLALLAEHRHLFGDVLQLAHVAGPFVGEHTLLGSLVERDAGKAVFLGYLHGKQAEEQQDVVAAFAERGHLNRDGVQTVVEVFAETALADSLADIHVGGGHHAHIGLHHLLTTHTDVFAALKHTQQAGLGGNGQFAHFVEEDGSLVGIAKVTLTLVHGIGERAFLMTEEFAVDGSLGNGSAVHCKVFLTPTGGMVVDETGNDFLSHATLTLDEYRQVGVGHLQGDVQGTVQRIAVAHDVVVALDVLKVVCFHWVTKLHIFTEKTAILADFLRNFFSAARASWEW